MRTLQISVSLQEILTKKIQWSLFLICIALLFSIFSCWGRSALELPVYYFIVIINDNNKKKTYIGSCLKTGQHSIFVIIHLFLPIIFFYFYSVSKILFQIFYLCYWISLPIMIVKMKIFLHTVYKIFNK